MVASEPCWPEQGSPASKMRPRKAKMSKLRSFSLLFLTTAMPADHGRRRHLGLRADRLKCIPNHRAGISNLRPIFYQPIDGAVQLLGFLRKIWVIIALFNHHVS